MIYDRFLDVGDIEYIKEILKAHRIEVLEEFKGVLKKC